VVERRRAQGALHHPLARQDDRGKHAAAQDFQLGGIGVVSTANDGYTRKAYSSAVRLVNPSAVRESQ
jgi:hypothetical protein